jgi:hypothetical protein
LILIWPNLHNVQHRSVQTKDILHIIQQNLYFRESRLLSARGERQNSRPSSAKSGANVSTTVTPVKLSRRDLRQIPDSELALRRSNMSQGRHSVGSPPPQGIMILLIELLRG